jgi:alpha-galactosidase
VLINNWEATYFHFTEEKILSLAHAAKELGIELLVLDDGWFGHRDDDTSSLGDWIVYQKKLPHGLKYLGEEINKLGLKLGLWFEPEMISKDSDLYRHHPDWLLHIPNRRLSHSRNQYVLDYSRKEVQDAIYDMMVAILENAPIAYVKWDMNRNMTEIGSATLPKERQKETAHRYILGVYDLMERITRRFPDVLFESCAGGGGRFDPGILHYMPQTWTSDDTDAVERLKIQYGTSLVYPLSSMGAHVSAVPNHQVRRITPIKTRAEVAFFGVFGYELDIERLPQDEKDAIKEQVAFYKANRELLQQGIFYRLISPFQENVTCWMVVSEDQRTALVGYYKVLALPNPRFFTVKFQGLLPDVQYELQGTGKTFYGDELMYLGFQLPVKTQNPGDFTSYVWKFQTK